VESLQEDLETQLIEDLASFSKDPLGWVYYSFEWGSGELAGFDGPDEWQKDILVQIRDGLVSVSEAIRIAVASGHGCGKSSLVSWLILWAISTFEDTKGVITANTDNQLRTKTWAEVAKWYRLFIGKDLFTLTATALYSNDPGHERTWRMDMVPWSENNTEAFAGLHNKSQRILIIFDEASSISDKIWEVTEGALTDENTEILWVAFGNPTRNTGRFFDCFHKFRHRWITRHIDSRTAKMTNKKQLQEWVEDYGEDSDFVKVRVRGLFPNTSDRQFIPSSYVDQAAGKHLNITQYEFAPVIIGVDPAIYGDDECVIYLRQGLMSKQLAVYRKIQDDLLLAGYVAKFEDEYQADAVFVDVGYGTGIVSGGRVLGRNWTLVNFGGESAHAGYFNKRAEIWGAAKDWLKEGGSIPDDPVIRQELAAPEYVVRLNGKIQLEKKEDMRKRGLASPNRADALALTFSYPVQKKRGGQHGKLEFVNMEYNPFSR
jgi:hypothetical protein